MLSTVAVPYWWHATLFELMWLTGGTIALPFAIANFRDAREDEDILDEVRNDPSIHSRHYYMLEEAANGRTFNEWMTIVSASLICVTGIIGCSVANPTRGVTTATGFAVTLCLDGLAIATAIRAYVAKARRERLYELAAGRSSVLAAELRAKNIPPS